MAQESMALIEAMYDIAEAGHPITGRGIGYKAFTKGLIASMAPSEMRRVYRLLTVARDQDLIPWHWIVDETRELERTSTWDDPEHYAQCVARSFRRDFWDQQPVRIEVWSEKGTVRGVLAPVLDEFAVGFRVMHGFSGGTTLRIVAEDDDGRPMILLYDGDFDPSGLFMSERDLPDRLVKYGGGHVDLERIALLAEDCVDLPSFPATDKAKDPRYAWFVKDFGHRCVELDAMDPNDLRERVRQEIVSRIDPIAWERCARINAAEQASLRDVLSEWGAR